MAVATGAEKLTVQPAEVEAEPKAEIFEVEIPEGLELETPGDAPAAEEVEPEPEPAAEEAPPKAKPAPKKEPKETARERLHPAVHEEREKRKKATKLWEETAAERDRLEAELRSRRSTTPVSAMSKEQMAALKERANKSDTMGELLEIVFEEIQKRDVQWASALGEERFNRFLHVNEAIARKDPAMPQYDKVLREAGIIAAVKVNPQDGTFADPAVAKKIYTSDDPAAMAYTIAVGKLETEGRLDEVLGKTQSKAREVEVEDDPDPEVDDEKGGKKPAAEVDAAGERRAGAREVIDKVASHSSKPRGLQAVKPAAPPKRGLTRQDLDKMSDTDPDGLSALFKANPKLKDWWLGGVADV